MSAPVIEAPTCSAWADRSDRVRIVVTGPDRAKVLHNLTTNDVKRLKPGRGCEAFVTNGQGKTLGFVAIHAEDDRILVRSDPGSAAPILEHFGKYGVFEDAEFRDVSAETSEFHLIDVAAGTDSLPSEDLGIGSLTVEGIPTQVIREAPTGWPGVTLILPRNDADVLRARLSTGGTELTGNAFDAMRIEAGTPVFGRDISAANLPQEINRDVRAISFVKGCYLGQETVARLDALGHVNKILVGFRCDSDRLPDAGSPLQHDGKEIGTVTSTAFSPNLGVGVGIGMVRVAQSKPGTVLQAITPTGPIPVSIEARPLR